MKNFLITFEISFEENFVYHSKRNSITIEDINLKTAEDVKRMFEIIKSNFNYPEKSKLVILFIYELTGD